MNFREFLYFITIFYIVSIVGTFFFYIKNLIKRHGCKQQCDISIKSYLSKHCSNNTRYVMFLKRSYVHYVRTFAWSILLKRILDKELDKGARM